MVRIAKKFLSKLNKFDASCTIEITPILFRVADELEFLGGPGYELAKRNLDLMDTLMQEVQEFYENWEKRVNDITDKHEEALRLHTKNKT